ncbi:MAG: alpha/beta hydrolase, partial [Chloroflexota bacterium]|nr:alpha/beta hydrolase [Chloroflexota bacterium]
YRVIRYDTRGFGQTETEAVEFSNRADVAAVLDHVGAPSAYVLGASRGAMIALDFTLERPERVTALVVAAGGIGGWQPDGEPAPEIKAFWDDTERRWEAHEWEALAAMETAFWVDGPGQPEGRVDAALRERVHDWILSNYGAEKPEGQPRPLEPSAASRLGELTVPLLVMVGDLDEPGTQAACRHLAASVSGARLELFAGAAHMLNLEQPDRFSRLVLDFLAEVDAARVV